MKQPNLKRRAQGGGRKPLPLDLKRVPVRLMVSPITKTGIESCALLLNCSQGKALDEAIKYLLHCLTHTA